MQIWMYPFRAMCSVYMYGPSQQAKDGLEMETTRTSPWGGLSQDLIDRSRDMCFLKCDLRMRGEK